MTAPRCPHGVPDDDPCEPCEDHARRFAFPEGAAPRAEGLPSESAERRLLLGLIDTLYGGAEKSDDLSDRLLAVAEVLDKVDSITDAYIAEKGADHLVSRGFQADLREASARLAAPRAEGLDWDQLREAMADEAFYIEDDEGNMVDYDRAATLILARLSRPSDERVPEPRTEAEKALDRLDEIAPTLWQQQPKGHPMAPMQIPIREWVKTIRATLAEAAQGAAPRAEGPCPCPNHRGDVCREDAP